MNQEYSYTLSVLTTLQGEPMFTPSSLSIALLMMITSAVCWGSWANTYKGVKGYRFELFYWDYAVGIFVISLVLAFTMGSTGHDTSSF
jgi:glucose uptake protein